MSFIIYIKCFFIALIGASLQAALYLKNTRDKSKLANVEFKPIMYLKEDWLSIGISLGTIILALLLTGEVLNLKPEVVNYIQIAYAFVGYFSHDIASRVFGSLNNKVNKVIDWKTTEADKAAGRLDAPTPIDTPPTSN